MTLNDTKSEGNYKIIYPAAMAKDDGSINYDALYESQDGTLATLSSNFDLAVYNGKFTGGKLQSGLRTLDNQLAILELSFKNNDSGKDITSSITQLQIKTSDSETYSVARTQTEGPVYVAISPTSSATITVTATDGSKNYIKVLSGKTYELNNLYPITWRISEVVLNLTDPSVGQLICNDGKNYANGSVPAGLTAVAKICYLNGANGLALALSDESSTMNWNDAVTAAGAHTPDISGGAWALPTRDQWETMITTASGYASLRDGFNSVGGDNMQANIYWSSTENGSDRNKAQRYNFNQGLWYAGTAKTTSSYVRACLVW